MNAGSGGDTITITATGTITLGSALPALAQNVTITGPGANLLTVSGNHAVRVFQVGDIVTANISNLTIANGASGDVGGGIYAGGSATLTLTNCGFTGNSANEAVGVHHHQDRWR